MNWIDLHFGAVLVIALAICALSSWWFDPPRRRVTVKPSKRVH